MSVAPAKPPVLTSPRAPVARWPGQVLRERFMEPLGLTAYRVAKELSVAPITISEILRGKRAISASMARRLGVYFGVDPLFWMSLQAWHDLQSPNGHHGTESVVERCEALQDRRVRLVAADGVLREEFWSVDGWQVQLDGEDPRRADRKPRRRAQPRATAPVKPAERKKNSAHRTGTRGNGQRPIDADPVRA
jgi:addiction module HigA family antidote